MFADDGFLHVQCFLLETNKTDGRKTIVRPAAEVMIWMDFSVDIKEPRSFDLFDLFDIWFFSPPFS